MIKNLEVQNLKYNGREVPNQFEIFYTEDNKRYKIFQSYNRMILKLENGVLTEVGKDWDYSRTTGKYRNIIIGMDKKAFEKMLKEDFKYNKKTETYKRIK